LKTSTGVVKDVTKITVDFKTSYDKEITVSNLVTYACISTGMHLEFVMHTTLNNIL